MMKFKSYKKLKNFKTFGPTIFNHFIFKEYWGSLASLVFRRTVKL